MTSPTQRTWGSYNDEVPIIRFMDRKRTNIIELDFNYIDSVILQESIDMPCVYGRVIFYDAGNGRMKNLFKEGVDYLEMELKGNRNKGGQYGKTYKLQFEVINLVSEEVNKLTQGGSDRITIDIAQYPAYRNLMVWNVSKGWENETISNIITDIFNEFLNGRKGDQVYRIEESVEATKKKLESYCSPFWSPIKNINYLKQYAISANGNAGYHCFFDMENRFNFRSLEDIFQKGNLHEIDLIDIVETTIKGAQKTTKKFVKDYFANFAHKEYYKYGLSGSSAERFNWFKKKHYALKRGYVDRQSNQINSLYEKEEDINNMFGSHRWSGWRGETDRDICSALADNTLITSLGAQSQTQIQVNGITEPFRVKAGDKIKISNKVQGIKENVEELHGNWFVRGVYHFWNNKVLIYTQNIDLCRVGKFEH